MRKKKIILITACGKKKEDIIGPAWKVYKSSRIKYLYKKSKEFGYDFYIISSKYGLINAEDTIEPYDEILTPQKAAFLLPQVVEILKNYDVIVYYSGGARSLYRTLIEKAAIKTNKKFISFGYANMGDISKVGDIINMMFLE